MHVTDMCAFEHKENMLLACHYEYNNDKCSFEEKVNQSYIKMLQQTFINKNNSTVLCIVGMAHLYLCEKIIILKKIKFYSKQIQSVGRVIIINQGSFNAGE